MITTVPIAVLIIFHDIKTVINEFKDVATAKAFYDSVEYQAARQKRLGAADFNMIIVEGA